MTRDEHLFLARWLAVLMPIAILLSVMFNDWVWVRVG